jgi:hypothetical protein
MTAKFSMPALAKTTAVCVLLECVLLLAFWLLSSTLENALFVWLFFFAPLSAWLGPFLYREFRADENAP